MTRATNQIEIGRWLMACRFEVLLNAGQPANGPEIAMEALDIAEKLEHILSVYKPHSDFSRINNLDANVSIAVSAATIELLKIAADVHEQTTGYFDLRAASLSDLWGFSRRSGHMPDRKQIEEAVAKLAAGRLDWNEESRTVTKSAADLRINSGGIGKGFALDKMAERFKNCGIADFLVHGGHSSILASGDRYDLETQKGWRIAVRHPDHLQRILGELTLCNTALGTSGPANQYFYFNGVRYGHIINPKTGWPVSGMLSLTVLHPSSAMADALATGLFVAGLDCAEDYCERHPETSFLAVLPTKRQGEAEVVTCNMPGDCWLPHVDSSF